MEMITVSARIDAGIFKKFAFFDIMKRQKRWRRPALFAAILLFCGIICFSQSSVKEGAVLLGTVLTVIALGVPAVYFYTFNMSINNQVVRQGLTRPRVVYNLEFDGNGIEVYNDSERAHYDWDKLYRIYRANGCVYIYSAPNKAFLLPEKDIKCGADTLWQLFERKVDEKKLFLK